MIDSIILSITLIAASASLMTGAILLRARLQREHLPLNVLP